MRSNPSAGDDRPGRLAACGAVAAAPAPAGCPLRPFRAVVDCPSATAVFLRPGEGGP